MKQRVQGRLNKGPGKSLLFKMNDHSIHYKKSSIAVKIPFVRENISRKYTLQGGAAELVAETEMGGTHLFTPLTLNLFIHKPKSSQRSLDCSTCLTFGVSIM